MAERHPAEPRLGFLLDEDVEHLYPLCPRGRVKRLKDVGLAHGAPDDDIVKKAYHRGLTIVTANKRDYIRAAERFVKTQAPKNDCGCPYGLVFFPSGLAVQQRLVPLLRDPEGRLRLGTEQFKWKDIHEQHLCVNIQRGGKVTVSRLLRCPDHRRRAQQRS